MAEEGKGSPMIQIQFNCNFLTSQILRVADHRGINAYGSFVAKMTAFASGAENCTCKRATATFLLQASEPQISGWLATL